MTTFLVENVSVPPEVEQAIDKRSSMAAVGNLNDYVKFQMAQGTGAARRRWRHRRRRRGTRDGHGHGAADDEPDRRPDGADHARHPGPAPAPNGAGAPELMTPAQVAQMLGVAESDVMSSLDAGDLKGRKIGTQWRVTRAAVDAFLKG